MPLPLPLAEFLFMLDVSLGISFLCEAQPSRPSSVASQIHCNSFYLFTPAPDTPLWRWDYVTFTIVYRLIVQGHGWHMEGSQNMTVEGMLTAHLLQARHWATLDMYRAHLRKPQHNPKRWVLTAITDEETKIQRDKVPSRICSRGWANRRLLVNLSSSTKVSHSSLVQPCKHGGNRAGTKQFCSNFLSPEMRMMTMIPGT